MASDSFQIDYDACKSELGTFTLTLGDAMNSIKKNPNEPTTRYDYKLKQGTTKLRMQIQNLEVLANEY